MAAVKAEDARLRETHEASALQSPEEFGVGILTAWWPATCVNEFSPRHDREGSMLRCYMRHGTPSGPCACCVNRVTRCCTFAQRTAATPRTPSRRRASTSCAWRRLVTTGCAMGRCRELRQSTPKCTRPTLRMAINTSAVAQPIGSAAHAHNARTPLRLCDYWTELTSATFS